MLLSKLSRVILASGIAILFMLLLSVAVQARYTFGDDAASSQLYKQQQDLAASLQKAAPIAVLQDVPLVVAVCVFVLLLYLARPLPYTRFSHILLLPSAPQPNGAS